MRCPFGKNESLHTNSLSGYQDLELYDARSGYRTGAR